MKLKKLRPVEKTGDVKEGKKSGKIVRKLSINVLKSSGIKIKDGPINNSISFTSFERWKSEQNTQLYDIPDGWITRTQAVRPGMHAAGDRDRRGRTSMEIEG